MPSTENLELFIERNFESDNVSFWLREHLGSVVCYYTIDNGYVTRIGVDPNDVSPNNDVKPFMRLPFYLASKFVELISVEAKAKGINIKEESEAVGKLKAVEAENLFLRQQLDRFINKATYLK